MKHITTKTLAIIVASCLCFLVVAKLAVDQALHLMLTQQASGIGRDWSHYLDNRLGDGLPTLLKDADAVSISNAELGVVVDAVSELFAVGKIFQVDFIDADCSCVASFTNLSHFENDTSDAQLTDGDSPTHASGEQPDRALVKHSTHTHATDSRFVAERHSSLMDVHYLLTYSGFESHSDGVRAGEWGSYLPIKERSVALVWNTELHRVALAQNNSALSHHSIAEIYHRIQRGDETKLALRLLIDMEEPAKRNQTVMYVVGGTILLLLLLSFGYPAVRHFENLRARRKSDAKAHFLAHHDVLTGLSNRNAFQETVPVRLKQAISEGHNGALFLIDIDNFKKINDFYGHHVGDQVLRQIAEMLKAQVSSDSMVARLGGDELAIVSFQNTGEDEIKFDGFDFSSSFQIDMDGGEEAFDVSFSVGIARFPRDGSELSELMRNADLALYDAKDKGKSTAREYRPAMKANFNQRQVLFNEFRAGLKSSQMVPFYQPVVCTRTGRVAGVEALVRWQHPQKGLICASDFSDVFEDREICELIGCQMIDKVTRDMAVWKEAKVPFERVGFNVNAANLLRSGFILDIVSSLARHGLSPNELAIEVTEKTIFGTNSGALFDKLHELREMGCEVVLDDFGTGYSSITHLKDLPYTFLKIARTFVSNIVDNPEDQAIVSSLIELGRSLDYKVVAEGVETYEQYEKVKELGFHLAQGYYYAKPVSASELPSVIEGVRARSFRHFQPQEFHEDVA